MTEVRDVERDEILLRIAGAISDAETVDWEAERHRSPDLSDSLERLRLVESMVRVASAPLEAPPEGTRAALPEAAHAAPDAGAAASRGEPDSAGPAVIAPRSWGPLRVLEKIGEGGFAEVFRAHDPTLDCDVALKLWRRDVEDQERLLDEAKRLARVRHDNVLVVHGADRFAGRAGMWTDLVRGETLEQRLERHGRYGAREAAAIGVELCRALCAMHAAGLVHRDVKTLNVMRTEHGRYVLMDFGCVGELEPAGNLVRTTTVRGTPMTMAPEQLLGQPVGPAADLYGLGVVLYRLVTGAYPIEAASYYELVERHRAGERVPLLDRRSDLPASFVHAVETALAADPALRFASAGAMEQALHRALLETEGGAEPTREPDHPEPVRPHEPPAPPIPLPVPWWRRRGVQVAAAVAVVVAAPFAYQALHDSSQRSRGDSFTKAPIRPEGTTPAPAATPAGPHPENGGATTPGSAGGDRVATGTGGEASGGQDAKPSGDVATPPVTKTGVTLAPAAPALQVEASLFRATPNGAERLVPGARISPGDGLFLEVRGSAPMHVYVLNEDTQGHMYVLFPVPAFDARNPLAADTRHRLPGTVGGRTTNWQVTSAGGRERVLVVASRRALTDLEGEIAGFPTPEVGAPVSYGEVSGPVAMRLRGMGGLVSGGPATGTTAGSGLGPVLDALQAAPTSARDPWMWMIELENPVR